MPKTIHYSRAFMWYHQITSDTCHAAKNVSQSWATLLVPKPQKPTLIESNEHSPPKYIYEGYVFHGSRCWTNSQELETLLTTCETDMMLRLLDIYQICTSYNQGSIYLKLIELSIFLTFCPPRMDSRLLYLMSVRNEFFRSLFCWRSKFFTDFLYSSSISTPLTL